MVLIAFFSSVVRAESPNPPRAGTWEARATYSFFKTEANYSSTGNTALVRNGSYVVMQGDLLAIYDWQPDWRFAAGLNAGWAQSDDGVLTRENSGANEIYFSSQKWFESGPLDIAPQVDLIYPFWRVDENNDETLIGEGAIRARGGVWTFWPLGTYKPFAYLGFEYRDGGRSYLVPYEAGVKFKFPRFWLQGSFRGYESVIDDADSDNQVIRESYLKTVNGGSLKFYSVNPSESQVAAEAGANFGAFGLQAGFAITVNGNNSANGWIAYGGLSFSPMAPLKKHDDGFSIRKERYDEQLFENERSVEPQFIENPDFKEPKGRAQQEAPDDPTRPPPPPAVKPSKPVEMQLELKRVPPKKRKKTSARKRKNLDKMMNDAENALEEQR